MLCENWRISFDFFFKEFFFLQMSTMSMMMIMMIMKENREFKVDKIVVMVIDARTFNSQLDRDVCVCITFLIFTKKNFFKISLKKTTTTTTTYDIHCAKNKRSGFFSFLGIRKKKSVKRFCFNDPYDNVCLA